MAAVVWVLNGNISIVLEHTVEPALLHRADTCDFLLRDVIQYVAVATCDCISGLRLSLDASSSHRVESRGVNRGGDIHIFRYERCWVAF